MKPYIYICICVCAALLAPALSGCGRQGIPAEAESHAQPQGTVALAPGEWPQNAYTEGLPVPPGAVDWAVLDMEWGNCSVSLVGVDETGYEDYMEALQQAGFSLVETRREEIRGQGYVAAGSLLSDGETWLSISYMPDRCTVYIALAP